MIIRGHTIENLRTLGSMYDQNCLAFKCQGRECRISADVLFQIIGDYWLSLEKKRKYWHVDGWSHAETFSDEEGQTAFEEVSE